MPLEFVRNDITAMHTDAVVNAANSRLQRGGGVCGAIFAKADSAKLQAACHEIGFCPTGSAVITPSFGLPAPFVIHAVGPVWDGGTHGESLLLRSAYMSSLDVARDHSLHSIAFPLISSGIYGFPKREALSVAVTAIGDWLKRSDSEMQVYLVVFDRSAFDLSSMLNRHVQEFIDEHYVDTHTFERPIPPRRMCSASVSRESSLPTAYAAPIENAYCEPSGSAPRSLEDMLLQSSETFSQMLLRFIEVRGMSDPEVYKHANLDRKLFSKIRSNPHYQPSKNTVLALCIALRLNIEQATDLLRLAGYALSPSNKGDLIVEYFIRKKFYDIHTVNETLFSFDQKLLGSQS